MWSANCVAGARGERTGKQSAARRASSRSASTSTREEIKAIVGAAQGRWRPILLTAIFTGLRASELRGLRWADIDFDKRELHVRQRADRYSAIGKPKSKSGERTVPLTPIVVKALREWRLAGPKSEAGLVFPSTGGLVEHHKNIVERGLVPTMIAAGVTSTWKIRTARRSSGRNTLAFTPSGASTRPGASIAARTAASNSRRRLFKSASAIPRS